MDRSHPFPFQLQRPAHKTGFTLVELLVASAAGALIVVAASLIIGPHLRSNQRLEAYTRLQERWVRVAYLLDTEVQSASDFSISGNSLILSLPTTRSDGSVVIKTIVYSLGGSGELLRNGPPIDKWGQLDPDAASTPQVVVAGITPNGFTPVIDGNGDTLLSLQYGINLIDPNTDITYSGKGSVARAKADCASLESDDGPCN